MTDPRVRKDGCCAQCGGPRTMPKTRQSGVDPDVYLLDSFCSSACCRAWYGIPLRPVGYISAENRGKYERVAA